MRRLAFAVSLQRVAFFACLGVAAALQAACSAERDAVAASEEVAAGDDVAHAVNPSSGFLDAYEAGFASHARETERRADAAQAESERVAFDRAFVESFDTLSSLRVPGLSGFIANQADRTLDSAATRLGVSARGLPESNALLMIAGWEAVHGRDIAPKDAQAILAQVHDMLEKKPPAAYMTNDQEWRLARSYALLAAVLLEERARQGGDSVETSTQLQATVAADFRRQTGMDLRAISVGPNGFQ